MPSITTWVRIEPRSRDTNLLPGTEAHLHDPLWLLGRQWQLGELTGFDGGSAITARTRASTARVDAIASADGQWRAFDPARTPLDTALAPRPTASSLEQRARTGYQLLQLVSGLDATRAALLDRFALSLAPDELARLDARERRYYATVASRVIDGDAAADALRPLLEAGPLPASSVPDAERDAATAAFRRWLVWRDALVRTSPAAAWQPDRLVSQFAARAGATQLAASDHVRTDVRWYDVDAAPAAAPGPPAESLVATSIPTHVRFRGSPARRYWDLEDASVNWSAIAAGPGDVARLLAIDLALTFADNWLLVPLDVPAGSLTVIDSLVVTDTFGERTLVRSAAELDGAARRWKFCETTSDGVRPLLFIPPATGAQVTGPTLTAIDFVRDDVGDVLWAIERIALGADGRPRDVVLPEAPTATPSTDGPPAYILGSAIPVSHHPFRARQTATGLELVRATVPDREPEPSRADLPLRLSVASAPRRPARLRSLYTLARSADGGYHLVHRRLLEPAAPSSAPALAFDQLAPR
jgi:hypothetical protein